MTVAQAEAIEARLDLDRLVQAGVEGAAEETFAFPARVPAAALQLRAPASSLLDGEGHNRYGHRMARRLAETDPEIAKALREEAQRQHRNLELIASENFVSEAVLEAMGSVLTNKYAEGYPGKRYYGGCEFVDVVEDLAIERAKELFGAEHANVQPHSGAQANMAVYFTLLKPGDTVLGPNLSHGGHLTARQPGELLGQASTRSSPTACARTPSGSTSTRCATWPSEHRPQADRRRRLGVTRARSTSRRSREIARRGRARR